MSMEKATQLDTGNLPPPDGFGSFGSFGVGLEHEHAPLFPIECLPPVLAAMARETAAAALVPESMPASCVLGAVSAALGAGLELCCGGERRTRGNLFLLIVAESGTGKDLAFRPIMQPLNDLEAELNESFQEETVPSLMAEQQLANADIEEAKKGVKGCTDSIERQAVLEDLRDAQRRKIDIEKRLAAVPVLVFTEPTREGLSETLSLQAGEASACMTPESRGVFAVLGGRYTSGKATDEDLWCMAFSGTAHAERRKGRPPVTLRRPCLSVLWMLQPDKAHEILSNDTLCSSGLLPRFMMFDSGADSEQLPETLPGITETTRVRWRELIEELAKAYRLDGGPFMVESGAGVFALMREYDNQTRRARNKRDSGELADVAPFAARWAEQAWRLALVLHAAEHGAGAHKHPLELSTAEAALTLIKWFVDRQLSLIQGKRMQRMRLKTERLCELLRRDYGGSANLGELSKRNGWPQEEVRTLAQKLPKLLKLEEHKPAGGGRPTMRVSIP